MGWVKGGLGNHLPEISVLWPSYLNSTFLRSTAITHDPLPFFLSHWSIHYILQNSINFKTWLFPVFFLFGFACLSPNLSLNPGHPWYQTTYSRRRGFRVYPYLTKIAGRIPNSEYAMTEDILMYIVHVPVCFRLHLRQPTRKQLCSKITYMRSRWNGNTH